MKKPLIILFVLLACFAVAGKAKAAAEFTATVKPSGQGGDYTTLFDAEAGLNNDLTLATIKVFSISTSTPTTIAAGDTLHGQTSNATGTAVLVNAARTQILIKSIQGTFQSGEVVQKTGDATKTVTLSNAGDSPIVGIKIDGDWSGGADTASTTIDGWTTTSTNYISIYTTTAARHNGKWDDTKYKMEISNASAILVKEENVRIDGLQIRILAVDADEQSGIYFSLYSGVADERVSNNIFRSGIVTAFKHWGILGYQIGSGTVKIWNNIIYDFISTNSYGGAGIFLYDSDTAYNMYNNTIHNSAKGLYNLSGTFVAKNNIVKGSGNTETYIGTFTSSNYNATDGTDIDDGGANSIQSSSLTFANETGDDFHLASDSAAVNAGTPDPGSSLFSDDIDGQTRSGAWDIGADEYFDTTPPSVSWVSPSANATVSSTVTLTASSTDNVAVSSVAFYKGSYGATLASSTLIGSTSTASGTLYSVSWNTSSTVNGSTTLWALATDTSNNTSTATTTVNVENPPAISNVTATNITSSGATITWTTDIAVDSTVSYGATSSYGSTSTDATLVTSHSITLSGLSASTLYHYAVTSAVNGISATSSDNIFTTASAGGSVGGGGGGGYSFDFQINGGATTTASNAVTLRINAVGASGIKTSNSPDFAGSRWLPYSSEYIWTLSPGSGTKTVYLDVNGPFIGTPPPISRTITVATTASTTPNIADLQAQLSSLIAVLNNLIVQAKEKGIPLPAGLIQAVVPTTAFTRDLYLGSKGDDVLALQQFLIDQNTGPAARKLAQTGATGYYGWLTRDALSEYQWSVGIRPSNGRFGPRTRAYVNSLK